MAIVIIDGLEYPVIRKQEEIFDALLMFGRYAMLYETPPKRLQWQYSTKTHPAWQNCTDEMYEQIKHLARYEFQQIEI